MKWPTLCLCLGLLSCSSPLFPAAPEARPDDLSPAERAWLKAHPGALTLFFNTEFPPLEFSSPDGEFAGLGSEVIAMVEARLGITFTKTPSTDWNRHLAALRDGTCAIAPTIVSTPDREEYALFTVPYAHSPVVIITARQSPAELTLDDLSGKKVAVVSGFATERYLLEQSNRRFQITPVKNVPEGLLLASFGQVDAFVENLAVAAYYVSKEGIPNLRVCGKTGFLFSWSIGVSKKYPLLFAAVKKALAQIRPEELESARKRWLALDLYVGPDPETLRFLKLAALFVGLLALALSAITIFLKRRLKDKVERLRESEEKYRELFTESRDGIVVLDPGGRFLDANVAFLSLVGYTLAELRSFDDFWAITTERWEREDFRDRQLQEKDSSGLYRKEYKRKDGTSFPVELNVFGIRGKQGETKYLWGIVRDITERCRAEEEREKLREQLVQAQKMESIGRLAGGVAHDFNNMLGVILGHAELALMKTDPSLSVAADLQEIRKAADRSADLTRQLLAFARRQTVLPKIMDLNNAVGGMHKMLRRLIGEDVQLVWLPGEDLGKIKMDPAQVSQVMTNLCINSRDALAGAGRITLETNNVSVGLPGGVARPEVLPGEYVLLTVSDSGCGMDQETLSRLFEPFFTTKELGKGTGLGLATVHGIVKQNGGFIEVHSEPGIGTSFEIFLPRRDGGAQAEEVPGVRDRAQLRGDGVTILLVEDERDILAMTRTMLENQGYKVLAVSSPTEALRMARAHTEKIGLLLTDVIMPEMNGRDLAERLRAHDPGIRALFTSGYTADVIAHHGVLGEGVHFLQKPFTIRELFSKVSEALTSP